MSAKCARMQVHHNKCNKTTPRPGPTLGPDAAPTQAQKRPCSKSLSPQRQVVEVVQLTFNQHIVKTDTNDEKIGQLFHGCNLPFSLVKHPLWKDVMEAHGYPSPTSKALAGPLLDKVYESLTEDMQKHVSTEKAALVCADWANQHNDPIIGTSLLGNDKSVFLESMPCATGAMKKDADNCKVTSVITDNAVYVFFMWVSSLTCRSRYPSTL